MPESSLPVAQTIVVVLSDRDTAKPVDWFARIVATLGAALGVGNIGFSLWKLFRDRRISVEDDFWFRKIVAPATIEPMLETLVELTHDLPNRATSVEAQAAYAQKVTTEFGKLYQGNKTLALFSAELPALVNDKLTKCEDLLTEYAGQFSVPDTGADKHASDVRDSVWRDLNEILHAIKTRHLDQ